MTSSRAAITRYVAVLFGFLITGWINYHSFVMNFRLVPGDLGDTRLVIFTLEHWLKVFLGREPFYVLQMFYPDKLALGYADGLFLFSLPYGLFRLLGLDYFTSYQLLFVFMTAFGYATCTWLLHRALRLDLGFAVLGAVLLTSLNSVQYQAEIGKLLGFYLYPALLGLLYFYIVTPDRSSWRAWLSLDLFAAGLGLLFFTSYYPAWFFLFTLIVFSIMALGALCIRQGLRSTLLAVCKFVRANGLQLGIAVAVLVVALIPFGVTYGPLVLADSKRSFALVLEFTPTIRDIINVSDLNYVWSPVLKWLKFSFGNREVQMGSPMLVLGLFMLFYIRQVLALAKGSSGDRHPQDDLVFLLSTTAVILFVLIIKYRGVSAWQLIYASVPGASALRALGRYLIIIDMIVAVGAIYGLNKAYRQWITGQKQASPFRIGGLIALAAALIVEEANGAAYRLDKHQQLAFLDRYQAPTTHCAGFFINNAPAADVPPGYYQLDAMMIGMKLGIPTVNGYSGIAPSNVFSMMPSGAEYKYGILQWLAENGADQGICELDYQSRSFQTVDVAQELPKYAHLNRQSFVDVFSTLLASIGKFLREGNAPSDLYPQFLEEHGYLDPSFGYQTGADYKWIQGRYWIGQRPCGKASCVAIGIVEAYGGRASQVLFPNPQVLEVGSTVSPDASGELLMVFPVESLSQ